MQAPLVFNPAMEHLEPDEAQTIEGLVETLLKISRTTYADGHHAIRSVHAKSHAILKGELTVLPGLPAELAQGLFARAASYSVVLRLSTTPGDILNDSVSTPRGLAIKILGVPGERLPGSEADSTQDFLMVNGPAFAAPDVKHFLKSLKLLAGTTDKAPALKSVLSAALRGTEKVIEGLGGKSGTLRALGGEPATNPLGETYFTQVPLLYGQYVAKLSLAPASNLLLDLKGEAVEITKSPNALREAIAEFFLTHDATWELRAQLCRDLEKMPIENAAVVWPENLSPFMPVARLTVPMQAGWNESRAVLVDDGMSFNPWHGIAAHRPLGSVMRARKAAYAASTKFRAEHNSHPIVEPTENIT